MNVLWFIMGLIIGAALTVLALACSALSSRIAENEDRTNTHTEKQNEQNEEET